MPKTYYLMSAEKKLLEFYPDSMKIVRVYEENLPSSSQAASRADATGHVAELASFSSWQKNIEQSAEKERRSTRHSWCDTRAFSQ